MRRCEISCGPARRRRTTCAANANSCFPSCCVTAGFTVEAAIGRLRTGAGSLARSSSTPPSRPDRFKGGRGQGVFSRQDIQAMSTALEDVCKILNLADAKSDRELLAKKIIALARQGECNAALLRDGMLREIAYAGGE